MRSMQHRSRWDRDTNDKFGPTRGGREGGRGRGGAGGESSRGGREGGRGRGSEGPWGFGGPLGFRGQFGPMGPGGPRGRSRARRGDVRQAILALLAEEPRNGYQIIQILDERTEGGWKPSPGAIYPSLAQLEDEGLIEATEANGGKAHTLTAAGAEAATSITEKPWDTFLAENAMPGGNHVAMWREFRSLAMATQELTRNGSPAQQEQAGALLKETRRKLYGLLAEADEVDNPDDLR